MSELDFSQLSDAELRQRFIQAGVSVGPIGPSTRKIFERKLKRLLAPESEEPSDTASSENEIKADENKIVENLGAATTPTSYFGVALPPEKWDAEKATECVFDDKKAALTFAKSEPGARFKEFQTKEQALAFASSPAVQQPAYMPPVKAPAGESSAFKGPKQPELNRFRMMIEKDQLTELYEAIWSNPRYLISSGDSPVILQVGCRYNSLHVCAIKNKTEAAEMVMSTLEDPAFMARLYPDDSDKARDDRIQHILDLYLNMPDKGNCESPLHFACKFGNVDMVRFLVHCKHINVEQLNLHGETPKQIVCTRAKNKDDKKEILQILEATFYVPLMRPADKSRIARVGKPWSASKGPAETGAEGNVDGRRGLGNPANNPTMSPLVMHAYAGPMSPSQANTFRRKWMQHTSQKDRLMFLSICCKDDEKGLERIGRLLAKEDGVRWSEYWEFLEDYLDLSTPEGLRVLDDYLEQIQLDASIHMCDSNGSFIEDSSMGFGAKKDAEEDSNVQEGSQGKGLEKNVQSIPNGDLGNNNNTEMEDDPLMAILGSQFSKMRLLSPSPIKKGVENIGASLNRMNDLDTKLQEMDLDNEMPQFCDTTKDGQGKFHSGISENAGIHSKQSVTSDANSSVETNLHQNQGISNSEQKGSISEEINPTSEVNSAARIKSRLERGSGDTEYESCGSESGESVSSFYTATDDVRDLDTLFTMSSPVQDNQPRIFLMGLVPTKCDTDVLHALGDQPITPEFPNVLRWHRHVTAFTEVARNSWASPRRAADRRLNLSLGASPTRERLLNSTPRRMPQVSRISPLVTPQRLTPKFGKPLTPTLQNRDAVRTNLFEQLDL